MLQFKMLSLYNRLWSGELIQNCVECVFIIKNKPIAAGHHSVYCSLFCEFCLLIWWLHPSRNQLVSLCDLTWFVFSLGFHENLFFSIAIDIVVIAIDFMIIVMLTKLTAMADFFLQKSRKRVNKWER